MRNSLLLRFFGRIVAGAIVVVVVTIGLKLALMMLGAVLPAAAMDLLGQGWDLLFQLIAPALAPLVALGLLWLIYWSVFGGGGSKS